MKTIVPFLLVLGAVAWLPAAEAPARASAPTPSAPRKPVNPVIADLMAGANWTFKPRADRTDPFYDREKYLLIERNRNRKAEEGLQHATGDAGNLQAFALNQVQTVERLVSDRKYDEAIRTANAAIKKLEPEIALPFVAESLTRLKGYREQAEEAVIRNEAQAAFDSLDLKIQGILFSDQSDRRCIISGEKQSHQINDRVKDCVIINIETDRVDFRFHYKRRRFEFPRYVGEDVKSAHK